MQNSADRWFPLRLFIYFSVVGLGFEVIVRLVQHYGWATIIPEGRVLEGAQVGTIAAVFLGLSGLALRFSDSRSLYTVLAGISGFALVREFNNSEMYDHVLPGRGKAVFALLLLALVCWRFRSSLWRTSAQLFHRSAFLLFLTGTAIICLWAQVLAQRALLEKRADRAVEESLEWAGYILLLFGVLEEWLACRRRRRSDFSCADSALQGSRRTVSRRLRQPSDDMPVITH